MVLKVLQLTSDMSSETAMHFFGGSRKVIYDWLVSNYTEENIKCL